MRQLTAINVIFLLFLTPVCQAADQDTFSDQKKKESYSLGFEFGSSLKRHGVEIDTDVLLSAIRAGLEGKMPAITPQEISSILIEQRKRLATLQNVRLREYMARNLEEGKVFLENNKTKEGVRTLPSGLQYKVVQDGTGPTPKITDSVMVNYKGTFIDGNEFDNSKNRKEQAPLPLIDMIQGWSEALQLMKTGSKWQLFVPSDLAYGQRQSGRIPPNSTLIFELELLNVMDGNNSALTGLSLTTDSTFPSGSEDRGRY